MTSIKWWPGGCKQLHEVENTGLFNMGFRLGTYSSKILQKGFKRRELHQEAKRNYAKCHSVAKNKIKKPVNDILTSSATIFSNVCCSPEGRVQQGNLQGFDKIMETKMIKEQNQYLVHRLGFLT